MSRLFSPHEWYTSIESDILTISPKTCPTAYLHTTRYLRVVCKWCSFQEHENFVCVGQRPIVLVLITINSCSYSTNDFVFI